MLTYSRSLRFQLMRSPSVVEEDDDEEDDEFEEPEPDDEGAL